MVTKRSLNRLQKYGISRLILSVEVIIPIIIILILLYIIGISPTEEQMNSFVEGGTNVSISLIAIIIAGISIIVSFSDQQFLSFLQENDIYDRVLFIFEYTAYIAILSSILGITIQTIGYTPLMFYLFTFIFTHLLIATIRLISIVITYGKKKGEYAAISDIDEEFLEKVKIPDELKGDSNEDNSEGEE